MSLYREAMGICVFIYMQRYYCLSICNFLLLLELPKHHEEVFSS